ncbi:MAG: response regulator [Myxococcota bacterium]|nr:response regulator [Myxococcota bacterium]
MIHDDGDALDVLTRLFEDSGFDVVTAINELRAQAHLEGDRAIDVVVAPWDLEHAVGGVVYRWSLQHRYDLRDQFVFLASEVPVEFDRLVAGRCLAVAFDQPAEIVRIALAAYKRKEHLEFTRDATFADVDGGKPTLLLAEDEPVLLMVIGDLLADAGFAVTKVESGNGAIARLDVEDFDAIVADWHMDDGSGADLYRWLIAHKAWLATRVVFLTGGEGDDAGAVAPGRQMFRKGQDSGTLIELLREIVREAGLDRTSLS